MRHMHAICRADSPMVLASSKQGLQAKKQLRLTALKRKTL